MDDPEKALLALSDYELSCVVADRINSLTRALQGLLDRHVELVSCGDCGFWDVEDEDEVKAARAALEPWKPNPQAGTHHP